MKNEIDWYRFDGETLAEDEMREEIRKHIIYIGETGFVKHAIAYSGESEFFEPIYEFVMEHFSTEEIIDMLELPAYKVDADD